MAAGDREPAHADAGLARSDREPVAVGLEDGSEGVEDPPRRLVALTGRPRFATERAEESPARRDTLLDDRDDLHAPLGKRRTRVDLLQLLHQPGRVEGLLDRRLDQRL